MDAEIKRKWVEALRSGEYRQAREMLRDIQTGGLCCLGVGYSVLHPDKDLFSDNCLVTTAGAANALDLACGEETALVRMNDDEMKSFSQIADYIEANL